jgi:uncharacterized protein YhaN
MRILRLQFRPFGCFRDTTLPFEGKPGCLHVVYGRNEAGKSTALRAIRGFLFGIPARSTDVFRHEARSLRILGELEGRDGACKTFVRRKGNRDTLLSEEGLPVPDSALAPYLGGISADLFSTLFSLDHDMLLRGGADLLAGRGAMAESLFQAGTGLVGLRKVLQTLEEESEQLFKARGSLSPVNQALAAYDEARRQLRESIVSPKDWKADQLACDQLEAQLTEVRKRIEETRRSLHQLDRVRMAHPVSVAYRHVKAQLEELGPVVLLPEDVRSRRLDLQRQEREARVQVGLSSSRLAKLEQDLNASAVPPGWVEQADGITRMVQRVDGYRNAKRDLPAIHAKCRSLEAEAKGMLNALHPALELEQAGALRIPDLQKKRLQRLASQLGLLQEKLAHTQKAASRQEQKVKSASGESVEFPALPDPAELERVLQSAETAGSWDDQAEQEAARMAALTAKAEKELLLLGLWEGRLEEVDLLRLPLPETVDRMDQALVDLETAATRQRSRRSETVAELSRVQLELETARLAGSVPTEQDLVSLRQRRDLGWQLIRQCWLEKVSDPAAEAAFAVGNSLPRAYENAVVDADTVADRLRREADRTARFAALQAGLQEAQRRLGELDTESESLDARRSEWMSKWSETWREALVTPLSPREMRSWLTRHANLCRTVVELRASRESAARVDLARGQLRRRLRDAIVAVGEKNPDPEATLTELLRCGAALIRRVEEVRRLHQESRRASQRAAEELSLLRSEANEAMGALDACKREWSSMVESLRLPISFQPEETLGVLERLDLVFSTLRERASLELRIREMESYLQLFQQEATSLGMRLVPDLGSEPPDVVVGQLHSRLGVAQSCFARQQTLEKQSDEERQVLQRAESVLHQAAIELRTLLESCACASVSELERQEERSERSRDLDRELEVHCRHLIELAGGSSLEVFLGELAGLDADSLPSKIQEKGETVQQLEEDRSQLEQQVALARQRLADRAGTAKANQAAQNLQSSLASIRSGAELYMRSRLAAEILRRNMERYREKNQDPILKRVHQLFPQLTLGSLAGVKVGLDEEDRVVLLGTRPGGEEVSVDGMSSGTRDQLFLALRLASLERYMENSEPLPLILDDVFINFDDDRTRAALRVLGELCAVTQVVYFTHHSRLVELAREVFHVELLQNQVLEG